MSKIVVVSRDVYRSLSSARRGGRIQAFVHSHGKLAGTVDAIASSSTKPISCKILPVDSTKNALRGIKTNRIEVFLERR